MANAKVTRVEITKPSGDIVTSDTTWIEVWGNIYVDQPLELYEKVELVLIVNGQVVRTEEKYCEGCTVVPFIDNVDLPYYGSITIQYAARIVTSWGPQQDYVYSNTVTVTVETPNVTRVVAGSVPNAPRTVGIAVYHTNTACRETEREKCGCVVIAVAVDSTSNIVYVFETAAPAYYSYSTPYGGGIDVETIYFDVDTIKQYLHDGWNNLYFGAYWYDCVTKPPKEIFTWSNPFQVYKEPAQAPAPAPAPEPQPQPVPSPGPTPSPPQPRASRVISVTVTGVDPNPTVVGKVTNINVKVDLDGPAVGDGDCVVFALAIGDTGNIVQYFHMLLTPGASSASAALPIVFHQPGVYTVYVGAKYMTACTGSPM